MREKEAVERAEASGLSGADGDASGMPRRSGWEGPGEGRGSAWEGDEGGSGSKEGRNGLAWGKSSTQAG